MTRYLTLFEKKYAVFLKDTFKKGTICAFLAICSFSTILSCHNALPFHEESEDPKFSLNLASGVDTSIWNFEVGNRAIIDQSMFSMPDSGYFPDGNISVVELDGEYYAFWANYRNYRSVANSPFLEDHVGQLNPSIPVFGGRTDNNGPSNGFYDGGMWLIGVRELLDGRLVGFFHAESHWYPRSTQGWMAYKSIGVAYSSNKGMSWGTPHLILRHELAKDTIPKWSGLGDGCVIFNHLNNKYYCFYTPAIGATAISMASTTDPNGYIGSWKKWYNGSFSEAPIRGKESPLSPLSQKPGANPAVHWNDFLGKFVMVWHGWDGKIYISASEDCENWEIPRLLLEDGDKAWYPNMIGYSSVEGGQQMKLYYSYDFQDDGRRKMAYREVVFSKNYYRK